MLKKKSLNRMRFTSNFDKIRKTYQQRNCQTTHLVCGVLKFLLLFHIFKGWQTNIIPSSCYRIFFAYREEKLRQFSRIADELFLIWKIKKDRKSATSEIEIRGFVVSPSLWYVLCALYPAPTMFLCLSYLLLLSWLYHPSLASHHHELHSSRKLLPFSL